MAEIEATRSLSEAVKLLNRYSCGKISNDSPEDLQQLKDAIALVLPESSWENLGICADNFNQGWQALQSYLKALGYSRATMIDVPADPDEPVYIKFNTQKMSYYTDTYRGSERGVLIATQGDEEAVLGTFGYFSLDLFT